MLSKVLKLARTGKEDAKKAHRSGKVPVEECAKSCIAKIKKDHKRKQPTCSNCKVMGHNASNCPLPKYKKRPNVDLTTYDMNDLEIKVLAKKRKLDFVTAEEWIV